MTLAELKRWNADREKILAWLAHIGEIDQKRIDETLRNCEADPEVREFFVAKHREVEGLNA